MLSHGIYIRYKANDVGITLTVRTSGNLHCVCALHRSGRVDRSTMRRFDVPYTFNVGSTTPPASCGSIEAVPQVSKANLSESYDHSVEQIRTPDSCDILANKLCA